jgi:hypothetical protein
MVREGKGELTLGSVLATRQIAYLHPDQPLETALRYMDRWPLIPVVSRADFRKLEGVISQQDVLRSYGAVGPTVRTPRQSILLNKNQSSSQP